MGNLIGTFRIQNPQREKCILALISAALLSREEGVKRERYGKWIIGIWSDARVWVVKIWASYQRVNVDREVKKESEINTLFRWMFIGSDLTARWIFKTHCWAFVWTRVLRINEWFVLIRIHYWPYWRGTFAELHLNNLYLAAVALFVFILLTFFISSTGDSSWRLCACNSFHYAFASKTWRSDINAQSGKRGHSNSLSRLFKLCAITSRFPQKTSMPLDAPIRESTER